ncbi:MAG: hypothetical protein IJ860_10745, partial [Eubacterium sp.]|nr:hypothetical protein [Eubacterium sp.]
MVRSTDLQDYCEKTGMTPEEVGSHLDQFNDGASLLMSDEAYAAYVQGDDWIADSIGRGPDAHDPNGSMFVAPSGKIDEILKNSNGDISKIEEALGMDPGAFGNGPLHRVDIDNPKDHGLRMATGEEAGANKNFNNGKGLEGYRGLTSGGVPEAVIDKVPSNANDLHVGSLIDTHRTALPAPEIAGLLPPGKDGPPPGGNGNTPPPPGGAAAPAHPSTGNGVPALPPGKEPLPLSPGYPVPVSQNTDNPEGTKEKGEGEVPNEPQTAEADNTNPDADKSTQTQTPESTENTGNAENAEGAGNEEDAANANHASDAENADSADNTEEHANDGKDQGNEVDTANSEDPNKDSSKDPNEPVDESGTENPTDTPGEETPDDGPGEEAPEDGPGEEAPEDEPGEEGSSEGEGEGDDVD